MDIEKINELPNSLEEHWMPFTANRDYKESPRLMVNAKGVYYTDHRGNQLIDASSGLFCNPAGHSRPEITEAVSKQLEKLDYVQPFQQGFGGSFELARKISQHTPEDLNRTHKKYGHKVINAEPGDVLFFHSLLIHGSGHNISPNPRMIILTQVNPKKDRPLNSSSKVRKFNMSRAKQEIKSAKRKYEFYKSKYKKQLKNKKVIFNNPIPKEEM